jgi:hypothetical protein
MSFAINSLGFKRSPACRKLPLPSVPLQHVRVCVKINNETQVSIQQGCLIGPEAACNISYKAGVTEDSWGKKNRTVIWDHYVKDGSFLQLHFGQSVGVCTNPSSCGLGPLVDDTRTNSNQLLKFEVNDEDLTGYLEKVLQGSGKDGCVSLSGSCGETRFESLSTIPWNSIIQVGPIGETKPA